MVQRSELKTVDIQTALEEDNKIPNLYFTRSLHYQKSHSHSIKHSMKK